MVDTLLGENKNNEEEQTDKSLLCGWLRWRPQFLQKFATPKCFIVLLSLFSVTQAILVLGVTSVTIPAIEKEFGLTSKQSAVILLSNDIGAILLLPVISFLGTHGKKPKWIGIGALITGIGALMMCLPKLMIGDYKLTGLSSGQPMKSALCSKAFFRSSSSMCGGNRGFASSTKYLTFFVLAQVVMGLGTTPLVPLATAYLDENVDPKMSPVYIGIWSLCNFFGPGIGYLLGGISLKTFTNLSLPEGIVLSRTDYRWIGAWWLPFLLISFPILLIGSLLLCFPHEMPESRKKRLEAINKGNLPAANDNLGKGFKEMLKATINLLKNKTLVFSTLALTVKIMFAVSMMGFFSKIIVLKFGGSFSDVATYTSAVFIPGSGLGIAAGSLCMRFVKVKDSAKRSAMLITGATLLLCFFNAVWYLPGCTTTNLAGIVTPYSNSSIGDSIVSACNAQCACSRRSYQPVCGEDGKTYFSPCFAGCQFNASSEYANCSCIDPTWIHINATTNKLTKAFSNASKINSFMAKKVVYSKASAGACDRRCKNMLFFFITIGFSSTFSFFSLVPQKIMTLRCVPDNQRAYAIGFQLLVMRLFSFIPGPIILGSIIDSNCLVWSIDSCGNRGNCLDYNVSSLSSHFFKFSIASTGSAVIFYALAWLFYVPAETEDMKIDNEVELLNSKKDGNQNNPDA